MIEQEEKQEQEVTEEQNPEILEEQQEQAETQEKEEGEVKAEIKAEVKHEPTLEEQIAEEKDKLLRLRADFDNYRKRMAREADDIRERSKMIVITDFLPVYDFFRMAMEHAAHTEDLNALKQGMQMIQNEFTRALDDLGVKEINAVGETFNPALHDAIKTENSDTIPEGQVISQWKSGYKLGERLIRPATVVVSAGPAKQEKQENKENKEEK